MSALLVALDATPVAPEGIGGSQYLSAIVGVVIPILVAIVTKHSTSATVKSVLLLLLSGVSGFLTEMINDAAFNWQQALFGAILTFVVGVASYFGLWKPTGVDAKLKESVISDNGRPLDERGAARLYAVGIALFVIGLLLYIFVSGVLGVIGMVVGIALVVIDLVSGAARTR